MDNYIKNINKKEIQYSKSGLNPKIFKYIFGYATGITTLYSLFVGVKDEQKDKIIVSITRNLDIKKQERNKLENELEDNNLTDIQKSKILKEIKELRAKENYNENNIINSFTKMDKEIEEFYDSITNDKSKFLPIDISKLLDNFDPIQKFAFAILCFSQVVLSSLISIIFIFYGDYLIRRFDLENKYPKLAKFIQLRRKFQNYYLFVCII